LSELYGFDQQTSYQFAFTYIRQLAIHLRNSITTKTQETHRIVYCWQFIHSLDFFSRLLSQHVGADKSSPLQPLIYPLVQVTLGAVTLNTSSQYFPLRFHLVEVLLRLSRKMGVYIPLAPTILGPLDSSLLKATLSKKAAANVLKPVEFETTLRVSSTYLSGPSSRVYRDQVADKLVCLLGEFFNLHALNPAFPELALPTLTMIKRWLKRHGGDCGAKVRHALLGFVEHVELQSKWVEDKRCGMEFSPGNCHDIQVVKVGDDGPLRKWIQRKEAIVN
jgi:nucleolar complex protein 2